MTESNENGNSKTTEVKKIVKNATDLQRLKLERLMKNPVSVKNGFIILYLLNSLTSGIIGMIILFEKPNFLKTSFGKWLEYNYLNE